MPEAAWYTELRDRYRPEGVKLLLIGESAPDPGAAGPRFFYAPILAAADNLFRGVVLALYDYRFPRGSAGISKVPWLERLKDDGVFLIDLVPFPVNALKTAARARARRDAVTTAVRAASALEPGGIIVCHDPSFRVLRDPLQDAWPTAATRPADPVSAGQQARGVRRGGSRGVATSRVGESMPSGHSRTARGGLTRSCDPSVRGEFSKRWGGRTPKAGGRGPDGRTWDEMPQPRVAVPA